MQLTPFGRPNPAAQVPTDIINVRQLVELGSMCLLVALLAYKLVVEDSCWENNLLPG